MKQQTHTLLCVDDDTDTRELVQVIFEQEGYQVTALPDPQQAIKLAKQENFDAIILDYWMPEIDGTDVCRAIRSFNRTVPIVFFTASARKHDHDKILESGAQAVLVKPIDIKNLTATVTQLVEQ